MPHYPIIVHTISISPAHSYFGQDPSAFTANQSPAFNMFSVQAHAGKGLVGDRFYNVKPDFDGQVTFVAKEVVDLLRRELDAPTVRAEWLRRNVVVEGVDLNGLIGHDFEITYAEDQSNVAFRGTKHCSPCQWMDLGVAAGARKLLKGRGGLRAQVLSSGLLRIGAAELSTDAALNLDAITKPLPRPNLP